MTRTYIPRAVRERVRAQARNRCGYCLSQEAVTGQPLEIEHIVPEARGGTSAEMNLWLACGQCNLRKGERIVGVDPQTGTRAPLFDPRRQRWAEHFVWADGASVIVGVTATGRATMDTPDLNRQILVDARRIWVAAGWHPPVD